MSEDIKELHDIMNDLRQKTLQGDNGDLLGHAIQIQRNRLLKEALFEVYPHGSNGPMYQSNLQKIAENS